MLQSMQTNHNDNGLLAKQEITESNVRNYPRRIPIAIQKAKGCMITDDQGKKYFDCLAGAGTLALGHHHPDIIHSIHDLLSKEIPFLTLDLTTVIKQQFIDTILASLPSYFDPSSVVQFTGPTGADAIEASIKLAKRITGREGIIAFHGAYHGMTHGALAVTGNLKARESISGLMPNVHFMPYPYAYRCPFGIGEEGWQTGLYYLEQVLTDPESGVPKPAAILVEVIQGEGGVIPAPNEWLVSLRAMTERHGIILIVDEVQTGIGRTGHFYACEASGIQPDILVLSKAIGGGLPLSILVFAKKWDVWNPGQHTGTFRGNQLAMAAGIKTLQIIHHPTFLAHVNKVGNRLKSHLLALQKEMEEIAEVRGRGLMLGLEIVNVNAPPNHLNHYPVHSMLARKIQTQCLKEGLIVELGGRGDSTVRFLPPLIVTEEEIDDIAMRFRRAYLKSQHEK